MSGDPTDDSNAGGYLQLTFPQAPQSLYHAAKAYLDVDQSKVPNTNFLKGCKWSPDGACLLTASDDNSLRIYDLPTDAYQAQAAGPVSTELDAQLASGPDSLPVALHITEGELVYDYCWYPQMLASDAASCCLASSCRGIPIHLWDAVSGQLRCSYRGYDDADEPTPAFSLAFSPDGSRLLGGYNRCIRAFDVARPGRDYVRVNTYRKREEGLPGIISCLAFSREQPGGMLAAGSYTGAAGVLDAGSLQLLYVLHGHKGGITQVQFSPDGNFLFTGARQDSQLLCWDVRYTSDVVYRLQRSTAATNQRIQFDVEPCGRHLITGGSDSCVLAFDLRTGEEVQQVQVAGDTVNGCTVHPYLPLLATASGERRYPLPDAEEQEGAQEGGAAVAGLTNCLRVLRMEYEWLQYEQVEEQEQGQGQDMEGVQEQGAGAAGSGGDAAPGGAADVMEEAAAADGAAEPGAADAAGSVQQQGVVQQEPVVV